MNYSEHSIRVETPFGAVSVVATEGKHVHVSTDRTCPINVNRVDWRISFHMNDYGNGFEMSRNEHGNREQWYLDRADNRNSSWESDRKAKAKIEATIPQLVILALQDQPAFLRRAEATRLAESEKSLEEEIAQLEREIAEKRSKIEETRLRIAGTRTALAAAEAAERAIVTVLE